MHSLSLTPTYTHTTPETAGERGALAAQVVLDIQCLAVVVTRVAHTRGPGPRLDALALKEPAVHLFEDFIRVSVSLARITLGEIVPVLSRL